MEKVTMTKINSVIRDAKALLKKSKNSILHQNIRALLILKKEFAKKYKAYIILKKKRELKTEKVYQHIVNILPDIEVDILKNGGLTINVSTKVPKDYSKLQLYLNNLIGLLEKMKIYALKKYIERIRLYLSALTSETEEEKNRYDVCCKEYEDVSRRILSEIATIEQFLNPEKNIIVNVRDRFD